MFSKIRKAGNGNFGISLIDRSGNNHSLSRHEIALLQLSPGRMMPHAAILAAKHPSRRVIWLLIKNGARKMAGGLVGKDEKREIISGLLRGYAEASFVELTHDSMTTRIAITKGERDLRGKTMLARAIMQENQYGVEEHMVKGKTVIDAGANIGIFSIHAALMGAEKVYAFEPVGKTFDILVENIRINGLGTTIEPINCALGDSNGIGTINYRYPGDGGASFVLQREFKESQIVEIRTIDSIFGANHSIGFVKIDSEGYESRILAGAAETVGMCRPVLSFSAYHYENDENDLMALVKKLWSGYDVIVRNVREKTLFCRQLRVAMA